jgi:histidinol-phosphate aminotransferase
VLTRLSQVPRAQEVYKIMADRGVVTRYRGSEPHCADCIRVSVGKPEENARMLDLLQRVVKELGVA